MKSVMKRDFGAMQKPNIPRSAFNRSHGYQTTFNAGDLVPIYYDEVLPNDTFSLNMSSFARVATPLVAPMDNLTMDFYFFFIPNDLIWDNWRKFTGEQVDPGDSIDYTIPQLQASTIAAGSNFDYAGLPTATANTIQPNNLFGRGLHLVYNEWFRDQNLIDSKTVDTGDGPDSYATYATVLKAAKKHDYFTSLLPWPQKGDAVQIPLGTSARVEFDQYNGSSIEKYPVFQGDGTNEPSIFGNDTYGTDTGASVLPNAESANLIADLSTATAATLNDLRLSIQTQEFLERDARFGTRYVEIVQSHFGVTPPGGRMYRPELLGMGRTGINFHPVPQTSESATNQLGTIGAFGTASRDGIGFYKTFREHGHVLGLAVVRSDERYQQGIDRMWSRQTRYDMYWPTFAHLGEQAVLSKELYADGSADDDNVLGYIPHWDDYRTKRSLITGQFRSNHASSLDMYHFGIEYGSRPTLDQTFIESQVPMSRVKAVTSEPDFIMDLYFNLISVRPMPTHSVPALGGRL